MLSTSAAPGRSWAFADCKETFHNGKNSSKLQAPIQQQNPPPKNTSQKGGVEALGRGQPPLDLGYRDLVLGGGGEEGEPPGGGAEHVHGKLGAHVHLALAPALVDAHLALDGEGYVSRQEAGVAVDVLQSQGSD